MSEHLEIGAVRIKNNCPQMLYSIEHDNNCLILTWVDYIEEYLQTHVVKTTDSFVTLRTFVNEDFPKPEKQVITL